MHWEKLLKESAGFYFMSTQSCKDIVKSNAFRNIIYRITVFTHISKLLCD